MPQVIYLPQQMNPLTDQLPQFLQQLVMLKMGHKMDMEKAQTAAKLASAMKTSETQEKAENKGFRPGPWDTSQPGVATIGGTPYKAPAPPQQGYVFNPTKGDFGEYEDRRATTLDQAYLRQNPNATPEQLAQYQQSKVLPKDPTVRDFTTGQNVVSRQFNRMTGQWEDVPNSTGAKFSPKSAGSSGEIDANSLTQEEIDFWGAKVNLTGKIPPLGMGTQAANARRAILKSAARQAINVPEAPEGTPKQTPVQAALETLGKESDTKSIQGSLNYLDKQLTSMGSFVQNLNSQVDRVGELANELKTFDARLLNVPLRSIRGRIAGSPIQAKYDMFLTEIESEIGKLATGSTASIAELSVGAQERWDKIHDKNLSVRDMLSLLQETKKAANYRYKSVNDQLKKTRIRIRTRDYRELDQNEPQNEKSDATKKANTVTVTNPETGEEEVWDLDTEKRIK